MKARGPLLLLSLSLALLAPDLTEAFVKKLIKRATLNTKSLDELDTFILDATKRLEEIKKSVDAMVKERRSSICCYDVLEQEDHQSKSLRSALYTTIVALSRLPDQVKEYRQQLKQTCDRCERPPLEVPCNWEDYRCRSEPEKCIPVIHRCDGKPHCSDASDEEPDNCFQYPCGLDILCEENQVCIPSTYRCDDVKDCPDASDERRCYVLHANTSPTDSVITPNKTIATVTTTSAKECESHQLKCESDGACIAAAWRCDGDEDCLDGSDEASCDFNSHASNGQECESHQLQCESDGVCIAAAWRCDGDEDCLDGSDEASCDSNSHASNGQECDDHQLKCETDGTCYPSIFRCDGEEDCQDGSDEASCDSPSNSTLTCPTKMFACASGLCVLELWRCDGIEDCKDGSDETGCSETTTESTETGALDTSCTADQLKCIPSGDCLPAAFRCDGNRDCSDGSDEENCITKGDACSGNPCSHSCVVAPWSARGFFCDCPEGMEIQAHNRHSCVPTGTKEV